MSEHIDFMGNPINVGDFVYRNEKLHKVIKLIPPGEWGRRRVQIDQIYPDTWHKPRNHDTDQLVIIPKVQMTAFLLKHKLPRKFVAD